MSENIYIQTEYDAFIELLHSGMSILYLKKNNEIVNLIPKEIKCIIKD